MRISRAASSSSSSRMRRTKRTGSLPSRRRNLLLSFLLMPMFLVVLLLLLLPSCCTGSLPNNDVDDDGILTIDVGRASYRPPYSQYGPAVEAVLAKAPHSFKVELSKRGHHDYDHPNDHPNNDHPNNALLVATWYGELGDAHLFEVPPPPPPGGDNHNNNNDDLLGVPYRLELATNAYQEAIQTLRTVLEELDSDESSSNDHDDHNVNETMDKYERALASVLFRLGEAYFADPNLRYLPDAMSHYQESRERYEKLRRRRRRRRRMTSTSTETTVGTQESNDDSERNELEEEENDDRIRIQTDKGYADSTAKVGMTLLLQIQHDPDSSTMFPMDVSNTREDDEVDMGYYWGTDGTIGVDDEWNQRMGTTVGDNYGDDSGDNMGGDTGGAAFANRYSQQQPKQQQNPFSAQSIERAREALLERLHEVSSYLDTAIMVYKQYLDDTSTSTSSSTLSLLPKLSPQDRYDFQASLALAYQQAATAALTLGERHHLIRARDLLHRAITVHESDLLPTAYENGDTGTLISSRTAVADLYLSLADTNLQLGDYPRSKEAYKNAMEWHEQYQIPLPPIASASATAAGGGDYDGGIWYDDDGQQHTMDGSVNAIVEESIRLYLQQLEDYRRMAHGGGGPLKKDAANVPYPKGTPDDEYLAASQLYYMERDDGYEGDLLAAIGALYLSKEDEYDYNYVDGPLGGNVDPGFESSSSSLSSSERGIQYLRRALELYEGNGGSSGASAASYADATGGGATTNKKKNRRAVADAKINLALAYFRTRQFAQSLIFQYEALDAYRELYGDGVNPYHQMMEEYQELVLQQHEAALAGGGVGGAEDAEYLQAVMAAMGMGGGTAGSGGDASAASNRAGPKTIDMEQYYKATAAAAAASASSSLYNTTEEQYEEDDDYDNYDGDSDGYVSETEDEELDQDEATHRLDEL